MWTIPDSATRAAWFAAATQQEQLELLAAALGSAPRKVVLGASGELSRVTMAAPTINTGTTPRRLELGQVIPSTLVNTALGTMTSTEIRSAAGTVILRATAGESAPATVIYADAEVKQRCAPSVGGTGIVVQANAALPAFAVSNLQVLADGIWGNDGDQNGTIEYNGAVYLGVSSNTGTGPRVIKHTLATGVTTVGPTLNSSIGANDHSAAFIQIRSDGRIVAFYCQQNDLTAMRYKISTNPEDVSSWGAEQQLTTGFTQVTYPYVVILGSLWVMFFRNETNFFYRTSTNEGTSWSGVTWAFQYAPGGRPYVLPFVRGSRIDCFLMQQDSGLNLLKTIHHVYCTASGTTLSFFNSAGTPMTLPIQSTDGTLVYDGTAFESAGYLTAGPSPDGTGTWLLVKRINSATDNDVYLVRQNGTTWQAPVFVADGGRPVVTTRTDYTYCAVFAPGDSTRVYAGTGVNATTGDLAVYRTTDGGATWAKERDVTTGAPTGVRNMRPAAIKNGSTYKVAWCRGGYVDLTSFSTAIWLGA